MINQSGIRTWLLGLAALCVLAACGGPAPTSTEPAATVTPPTSAVAEASSTSAANPDATQAAAEQAPTQSETVETHEPQTASAANESAPATDAENSAVTAPVNAVATDTAEAASSQASAVTMPEGPEPRLGSDYTRIDPPQQLAGVPGKVEVAEVFSYTCIHCARLDPLIPAWRASLPAGVNFIQVPMAHGAFEPIARGFYAAQAMGVLDQTHQGMFRALAEEHKLGAGKLEDVARVYAQLGIDPEALKATANSFTVNTQITRNQRTVARWGIAGTPCIVVAGKYLVVATADRGHEGMLQAARWLAQNELAHQAP